MKRLTILLPFLLLPSIAFAQGAEPQMRDEFYRAKVLRILEESDSSFAGIQREVQRVELKILDGEDESMVIEYEQGILNGREDMRLHAGDTVVVERLIKVDGSVDYLVREPYRLPSLLFLVLFFVFLGILCGGRTGLTSLLGLAASVLILVLFVVPWIAKGHNPLVISLVGSFAIAGTSIYLAHGMNFRTSLAVVSTMITLVLSICLAVGFVYAANLFGMGTEETVFLQMGPLQDVNLQGLLLGGIIIGALGVLDDITTAQVAAIDEISKANPALGFRELYQRGSSVGREHIASLINTLALAYFGASLPLLLLFSINRDMPWWVILNGEFLAEEIVRTLVGSSTLLLAVPISTWIAARMIPGRPGRGIAHSHHH